MIRLTFDVKVDPGEIAGLLGYTSYAYGFLLKRNSFVEGCFGILFFFFAGLSVSKSASLIRPYDSVASCTRSSI